jgi:hypothetical protein
MVLGLVLTLVLVGQLRLSEFLYQRPATSRGLFYPMDAPQVHGQIAQILEAIPTPQVPRRPDLLGKLLLRFASRRSSVVSLSISSACLPKLARRSNA